MEQKCTLNTRPGLHSLLVSLCPFQKDPAPPLTDCLGGPCERSRPPQLPCTYLPSSQSLLPPSLRSSRDHSASFLYHQSGNYLAHSRLVKKLLLLSHFSRVRLCLTPQTAAHQAPPSLGFSRQEHWSGLPFPSPTHESEK